MCNETLLGGSTGTSPRERNRVNEKLTVNHMGSTKQNKTNPQVNEIGTGMTDGKAKRREDVKRTDETQ